MSFLCFAACYALALVGEVAFLRWPTRGWRAAAFVLAALGVAAQALYLFRFVFGLPVGPSTLLWLSFILAVFHLSGSVHYRRQVWGVFILPVVLLLIGLAWVRPEGLTFAEPTTPVRVATWLHVGLLTLGEVGLCVGFIASVMYLVQAARLRAKRLSTTGRWQFLSLERLDTMNRRALAWAFPLITSGFLVGIALMQQTKWLAWWDAKIVATLVLWLAVGLLLYLRYGLHLQGRRVAWGTLVAFVLMLLAFVITAVFPSGHPTGGGGP
jgi:ABC-type transport system involved in cytochrome c biogenesis permease subunit